MKLLTQFHSLAAALLIGGAASANATLANFTDFNLGGTTASWDIFYGANYLPVFNFETGTLGNPSNSASPLTLTASVLASSATGPTGTNSAVPGDRELFYTFFSDNIAWSINSVATSTVTTYVFQSINSTGAAPGFANVLLNGIAPTSSSGTTWTWSGLNLASGSAVNLTFSSLSAHSAFDAFQIQSNGALTAVPEPSVTALGFAAGIFALVVIRRRRLARLNA